MAVDLLIKGGLIVDGSGSKAYPGDVAIKGGRIVGLGRVRESAARVIDAQGLAVAPGFWDVHTHYDAQLLWDPVATSSSWNGCTTVVMGNCGFTVAPCRAQDQAWLVKTLARVEGMSADVLNRTLPWRWESFQEYLDILDKRLGVNVIPQVGHTTVRRYVMGEEASQRAARPDEVERMRRAVADSLRAGAMGFTTSRITTHWDGDGQPVPSRLGTLDEYLTLVGELRNVNSGWVQAAALDFNHEVKNRIVKATGRPFCWNAIAQRSDEPDAWRRQLDRMLEMNRRGMRNFALGHSQPGDLEFTFDDTNIFDRWATWQKLFVESHQRRLAAFRDQALRDALKNEMLVDPLPMVPRRWDRMIVVRSVTGRHSRYEKRTFAEIGQETGKHPLDAALDLALDEDLRTQFRALNPKAQSPEAMLEILKTDHVVPGFADSGAHLITEVNTGFGTYLLGHWVREKQALSLEYAVHIMTGRPAAEAGVTDRGLLKEGNWADIVLFDPKTVAATEKAFVSDFPGGAARLVQHAQGVEYLIVNGVVTMRGEKPTGDLGGRTLRSGDFVPKAAAAV